MSSVAVHASPFSGSWYPGNRKELEELLESLFTDSELRTGSSLLPRGVGFVVPHAGLMYSGTVAAAAYRHWGQPPPERVVVMGFSHRGSTAGAWLPDAECYRTPLGDTCVDREAVARLASQPMFGQTSEEQLCDHSIEIQLPLLQRVAPQAKLVPVYVSQLDTHVRRAVARSLAELADSRTVFIASSDFTHYGRAFHFEPFPADQRVAGRLHDLDHAVVDAASGLNDEMFLKAIRETHATVCGYQPIALLLAIIRELEGREEHYQQKLDYQTSGEITGDFRHSVSYAALGYFPHSSFLLDEADQAALIESARRTLEGYRETGRREAVAPRRTSPALSRCGAAFVSLHKQGDLRGCVGMSAPTEALSRAVPEMTLAAALDDSRFPPLRRDETDIEIEISVLSPLKPIQSRSEFRVNQHGAMLQAGFRRGLLLPQVAPEYGWDAKQFFEALARKSGARMSVYDEPSTQLYVFRAQLIH
jgi:AmmeMemoRadiSam system protein B/AmmeMemoRadiSam system protein A